MAVPPDGAAYPHLLCGTGRWRSVGGIVLATAALLVVRARSLTWCSRSAGEACANGGPDGSGYT